jgi:hypothetical protein
MVRQASQTERVGTRGETAVSLAFERLEWAAIFNARHDIGTDLLLSPRTTQGVDLGLLIAAQIKSGPSAFRDPTNVASGFTEGWWFRDSGRTHVDSWADHVLPHLIILHDEKDEESYWAHVDRRSIVSTGKGAKVLVPKVNRIDEKNRESLVEVAETIKAGSTWEGSAWSGLAPPRSRDGLRYALIAPRLVAPHPNIGAKDPITPEQGVALLVQGRLRDYEHFAETHAKVPDLKGAARSRTWKWRFIAALARRIEFDDLDGLTKLIDSAKDGASHTAAVICTACGLLDRAKVDEGLELLEAALAEGRAEDVDRAWLEVQHARFCFEVGRIEETRASALRVQEIRAVAPADVTAGALAGAGAALLFNTSPWEPSELKRAITSGDTAVAWWRSQTARRGLDAVAERSFKRWARPSGVTLAAEDTVSVQLLSASMLANHAADHGGWRDLTGLWAQAQLSELSRNDDPKLAAEGLVSLVRAGSSEPLKNATRHLYADGPAEAITLAAEELGLSKATRTTAYAELALLQHAGAVFAQKTADTVARYLVDCIFKDAPYERLRRRISPTFHLYTQLVESLSGVLPAASLRVQRSVIRRLINLEPQKDQLPATAWRKVVLALPKRAWTAKTAGEVKPKPRRHEQTLQVVLLGIASRFEPAAKRSLIEKARKGSLSALASIGDVTNLPKSVVKTQVDELTDTLRRQAEKARRGSWGMGVYDLGRALVILNFWHPELAKWDSLLELLAEPKASAEHKSGAISALAGSPEKIPEQIRGKLGKISVGIASGKIGHGPTFFDEDQGIAGQALVLATSLGAIDFKESADPYVELLSSDHPRRIWAAHVATRLGRSADIGILVSLSDDEHPSVRAAAAAGLAYLLAKDKANSLAKSALKRSLSDPGIWVPRGIAGQLASIDERGAEARKLLRELQKSRFAPIRQVAEDPGQ